MSFVDIGWKDGDFVLDVGGHPQLVYDLDVIRQDLLARLHCPPPAHWAYPTLGVDLVSYVQGDTDPITLLALRQDIEMGVEQDGRVLLAQVTLSTPDLRTALADVTATLTSKAVLTLTTPIGGSYG